MSFLDRSDAGRRLANRMLHLRGEDVVVLGASPWRRAGRGGGGAGAGRAARRDRGPQARRAGPARAGHGRDRGGRRQDHQSRGGRHRARHRRARSPRWSGVSGPNSTGGHGASAATGPARRWPGGPRSSSTTASRPARPPGPPARSRGRRGRPGGAGGAGRAALRVHRAGGRCRRGDLPGDAGALPGDRRVVPGLLPDQRPRGGLAAAARCRGTQAGRDRAPGGRERRR